MTYGAQKNKEFPRLLCPRNNFLFLRAQRNGRVPHGLTPYRGKCIVLLYPSEHRGPILSTLSEPLSKQLVSVLVRPPGQGEVIDWTVKETTSRFAGLLGPRGWPGTRGALGSAGTGCERCNGHGDTPRVPGVHG